MVVMNHFMTKTDNCPSLDDCWVLSVCATSVTVKGESKGQGVPVLEYAPHHEDIRGHFRLTLRPFYPSYPWERRLVKPTSGPDAISWLPQGTTTFRKFCIYQLTRCHTIENVNIQIVCLLPEIELWLVVKSRSGHIFTKPWERGDLVAYSASDGFYTSFEDSQFCNISTSSYVEPGHFRVSCRRRRERLQESSLFVSEKGSSTNSTQHATRNTTSLNLIHETYVNWPYLSGHFLLQIDQFPDSVADRCVDAYCMDSRFSWSPTPPPICWQTFCAPYLSALKHWRVVCRRLPQFYSVRESSRNVFLCLSQCRERRCGPPCVVPKGEWR
jgi:hypothetical protein